MKRSVLSSRIFLFFYPHYILNWVGFCEVVFFFSLSLSYPSFPFCKMFLVSFFVRAGRWLSSSDWWTQRLQQVMIYCWHICVRAHAFGYVVTCKISRVNNHVIIAFFGSIFAMVLAFDFVVKHNEPKYICDAVIPRCYGKRSNLLRSGCSSGLARQCLDLTSSAYLAVFS